MPESDCVIALHQPNHRLLSEASHVIYCVRDLRDALLVYHLSLRIPADIALARRIVELSAACEQVASLTFAYETLLAEPAESLQKIGRYLGIHAGIPPYLWQNLRKLMTPAGPTPAAKPAGAFLAELPQATLEVVEAEFGWWLRARGYRCHTCPDTWAERSMDPAGGRESLWEEFEAQAKTPKENSTGNPLEPLNEFIARFGARKFQLTALDLLGVLGASPERLAEAHVNLRAVAASRTAVQYRPTDAPECPAETNAMASAPLFRSGKTSDKPLPLVSLSAKDAEPNLQKLARLVSGKTVAFLLHGSSIAEFSEHATLLAERDVVWVSLNHFTVLEERFLRPLGRELSIVFCCADGEVERRHVALQEFLERPGERLLITRPDHVAQLPSVFGSHPERVLEERLPPLWPYPNSLTLFLRLLVQAQPRRTVLFGCDGYLGDDDDSLPTYVGAEQFIREKRYSGVLLDTLLTNAHLPRILAQWRARLGSAFPEIVNCSPTTVIQGFPVIDYAQASAALAGDRLQTRRAAMPKPVAVPSPQSPNDPQPDLIHCLNTGRSGDLALAREHALRALRRDPARFSAFAKRVLQTNTTCVAAAYHFMKLTGGTHPGPAQTLAQDFARELRDTAAAVGNVQSSWDTWE